MDQLQDNFIMSWRRWKFLPVLETIIDKRVAATLWFIYILLFVAATTGLRINVGHRVKINLTEMTLSIIILVQTLSVDIRI